MSFECFSLSLTPSFFPLSFLKIKALFQHNPFYQ